ncbi:MAG TPA: phosphoribosylaminoimidazolesuccinocarboxamide synthase [Rhodothermales bacterium]
MEAITAVESPHIEAINRQLDHCLPGVDLSLYGKAYRGKVRDTVTTPDDRYVLVVSDRISAFDFVLREPIPFKGQVLNQLAAYFFEHTSDLVSNHVEAVPDPNVTIAKKCTVFPIEFVVRGYLAGHAWRTYKAGRRTLCGNTMPEGMRQNERFPTPLLTPTTKAVEGHDEDTSAEEIVARGLIGGDTYDRLRSYAFSLFERGTQMAAERGLILVDTKYEFGTLANGTIVLVDEVHTPDSSRYFHSDTYEQLLAADKPQRQLSKEFVREWLMDHGFAGKEGQTMPTLPDSFRAAVSARYIELFEAITGRGFEPAVSDDPVSRVMRAIERALWA